MLCRVIAVDQHRVGMGDFERAGGDRRQHGVEIERGGDRAADLLQHLELVDRLREIARALLHLGFEAGIGLVQLAGHAVELVGEFFQLVLGVDVDAMAEIAGAEPPRAGAQRRDRDQHAARQKRAGEDRDHEAERRSAARPAPAGRGSAPAPARSAARRTRTSRVSAPRCAAVSTAWPSASVPEVSGAPSGVIRAATCGRPERSLPISGPLAELASTWPRGIDHIGEGGLADLGVAEEIGEEPQIDIGHGDAGIEAGMRHRDRHEGLRCRGNRPARS